MVRSRGWEKASSVKLGNQKVAAKTLRNVKTWTGKQRLVEVVIQTVILGDFLATRAILFTAANEVPASGSLELVSVSEEELPVADGAFSYFRIFLTQAKVDPGENRSENRENDESPTCHLVIPVKYLIPVLFLVLLVALSVATGLIVHYTCPGKIRCQASSKCIKPEKRCDGVLDCPEGDDEYRCVRLSGKNAVLQAYTGGSWRTVCSDDWNAYYGNFTCKQLGFSSYVASSSVALGFVELQFTRQFVSLSKSQSFAGAMTLLQNVMQPREHCLSGNVTTLKCVLCGSRPNYSPSTRIVGGNASAEGQWPWQASLIYQGIHLCGGSLITSQWIVTAAHCVYDLFFPESWSVQVGHVNHQRDPQNTPVLVEKIIYHSKYKSNSMTNDIALIKLANPFTFNGLIQPICLPNYGEDFPEGKMCWISGWGATEEGGDTSQTMDYAGVPLISNRVCNTKYIYGGVIKPSMVCAGFLEGGVDTCQGDSGGPLACEDRKVWKLMGTTSWGVGCALRYKPGVYTRITSFLDWIHIQMEREERKKNVPFQNVSSLQ
ncbi:transmembrane protease serine 3 [Spea bombifrons]|uniref:transmembrane protease serine 3 n=1 Tax=Spea bombifrons TaxID=233779 RepID=UPI00234BDC88|nr:transmembrane protease serine 3 [Spea bombifrons]